MVTTLIDQTQPPFFNLAVCGIGNAGRNALDRHQIYREDFAGMHFTMFDYPLKHIEDTSLQATLENLLNECDCLLVFVDPLLDLGASSYMWELKEHISNLSRKPTYTFFVSPHDIGLNINYRHFFVDNCKVIIAEASTPLHAIMKIILPFVNGSRSCFGTDCAELFSLFAKYDQYFLVQSQKSCTDELLKEHPTLLDNLRTEKETQEYVFSGIVVVGSLGHSVTLDDFETIAYNEVEYWNVEEDDMRFQLEFNIDPFDETATLTTLYCTMPTVKLSEDYYGNLE